MCMPSPISPRQSLPGTHHFIRRFLESRRPGSQHFGADVVEWIGIVPYCRVLLFSGSPRMLEGWCMKFRGLHPPATTRAKEHEDENDSDEKDPANDVGFRYDPLDRSRPGCPVHFGKGESGNLHAIVWLRHKRIRSEFSKMKRWRIIGTLPCQHKGTSGRDGSGAQIFRIVAGVRGIMGKGTRVAGINASPPFRSGST